MCNESFVASFPIVKSGLFNRFSEKCTKGTIFGGLFIVKSIEIPFTEVYAMGSESFGDSCCCQNLFILLLKI